MLVRALAVGHGPARMLPYQNAEIGIDERLDDLLSRMTLPEKVGQMLQLDGRQDCVALVEKYAPGSLLHVLDERLDRAMQAAARTRLGIPLLVGEDGIHGHSFHAGATIFPTQLGLACSWNPDLLRDVARVTAREMALTGAHWTFSPVLCIARDLRWGRVGETFGEDAFLIGELGAAMIEGYQGRGLNDPEAVLATAKHYAGYSESQGGFDASEGELSRRKLRTYFFPPFERAARAGCRAFMTGYNAMDGLPSTANRWLLREVLREEWAFEGVVVTDWDNVGRLHWGQRIVPSILEAAVVAVRAGNDVIMVTPDFYEAAQQAVAQGLLAESEIDVVVRRILRLKFELGLFENPRAPRFAEQAAVIGCAPHREVALRAARESLVLLQNDGLLPLSAERLRHISVIGPNADDDLAQLGDWSLGASQYPPDFGKHPRECSTTILDGVRARVPQVQVSSCKGCSSVEAGLEGLAEARALAEASDVCVLVLGDSLPFNGETNSTATLELMGGQKALLAAVASTGKPFVLVLINGKPLVLPEEAQRASAIVECFNPGMLGGTAVAELLFGDLNPIGKLPISIPRHVGQTPIAYTRLEHRHGKNYADLSAQPAFPFGHGLSYTQFLYSNLTTSTPVLEAGQTAVVEFDLANVGEREGIEIVQLYVSDLVASVTWPRQLLQAFTRVGLQPGEKRRVRLEVPFERLALIDAFERRVVEPGHFELRVGGSSRRTDQLAVEIEVLGQVDPLSRIPGILPEN
ncbi:MAG TPA: glycoside hydrolase family 3 N-terminal domain-containing protein [Polyangiaceae bacterium]|nr:glycoside hydrolase family 3 N-terminal domain-containing protein [Polyangiaceae bacterium]